jgi:hypothetical protein
MARCHFVHAAWCTPVAYAPQGIDLHMEPIAGDVVYWVKNEGKAVLITQRTLIFDEDHQSVSVLFKVNELPAIEQEGITQQLTR